MEGKDEAIINAKPIPNSSETNKLKLEIQKVVV